MFQNPLFITEFVRCQIKTALTQNRGFARSCGGFDGFGFCIGPIFDIYSVVTMRVQGMLSVNETLTVDLDLQCSRAQSLAHSQCFFFTFSLSCAMRARLEKRNLISPSS